ncbi:unnamed protein product [Chondrus crispus]|uniref:UTP23 sensor motif region domain-containing protein n=1 Tax=Chondrus crispus TaxID=2769 RepID=R7QS07_CHOCR|nr:unnamed protein product [Chondrus crispus]CDF40493.1 unnamed protein product [Chondrus crispus]|eukprot:XP_005710787.1 unnamed protein product [Chondrus crispus]
MRTATGKGNNARKVLSYYSVNFAISAPYQVLCDGPTIFQSMRKDIFLKHALPTLLGGTAYPVVTDCIVKELRALGEDFSNASIFAKRATRVPCAHQDDVSASECIMARLRVPLEKKLFCATNDTELLAKISRTPGIPTITIVNETKLALRSPSRATLYHVQKQENAKTSCLGTSDKAFLKKFETETASKDHAPNPAKKRKRAKGPNPLSMKKAKKAGVQPCSKQSQSTQEFHNKGNQSESSLPRGDKTTKVSEASIPQGNSSDEKTKSEVGLHDENTVAGVRQESKKKRKRRKPKRSGTTAFIASPTTTEAEQTDGPVGLGGNVVVDALPKSKRAGEGPPELSDMNEIAQGETQKPKKTSATANTRRIGLKVKSKVTDTPISKAPVSGTKPIEDDNEEGRPTSMTLVIAGQQQTRVLSNPLNGTQLLSSMQGLEGSLRHGPVVGTPPQALPPPAKKKQRKNRRRRPKKNEESPETNQRSIAPQVSTE